MKDVFLSRQGYGRLPIIRFHLYPKSLLRNVNHLCTGFEAQLLDQARDPKLKVCQPQGFVNQIWLLTLIFPGATESADYLVPDVDAIAKYPVEQQVEFICLQVSGRELRRENDVDQTRSGILYL